MCVFTLKRMFCHPLGALTFGVQICLAPRCSSTMGHCTEQAFSIRLLNECGKRTFIELAYPQDLKSFAICLTNVIVHNFLKLINKITV